MNLRYTRYASPVGSKIFMKFSQPEAAHKALTQTSVHKLNNRGRSKRGWVGARRNKRGGRSATKYFQLLIYLWKKCSAKNPKCWTKIWFSREMIDFKWGFWRELLVTPIRSFYTPLYPLNKCYSSKIIKNNLEWNRPFFHPWQKITFGIKSHGWIFFQKLIMVPPM